MQGKITKSQKKNVKMNLKITIFFLSYLQESDKIVQSF